MKFYREGQEIIDIDVDSKTTLHQSLLGKDYVKCNFSLGSYFEFKIGDYVVWKNRTYTIFKEPSFIKEKANLFKYSFELESDFYRFLDALYMFEYQTDFSLMGNLEKFANLVVLNLNRISGAGYYQLGSVPETLTKNLTFNDENCLTVIQKISKEFEFEFQYDHENRLISFVDKIGVDTGLTFEFRKGLRTIEREKVNDKNIITNLYAFGGERNIPKDYGSRKLKIDLIENNENLFGKIEGVVNFEEVYPHRLGAVTQTNENNILEFKDSDLDFDINNQLFEGVKVKITFNTGKLAGYEFELDSYNHDSKTFFLISYVDNNGLEFPNENIKISDGDTFVIHDIIMPQEYITNAENLLLEKASKYLLENSLPSVVYNIKSDYPYLRRNLIQLNVGDIIEVRDLELNITFKTRILELTQNLSNKYEYPSIKIGNNIKVGYISEVRNNLVSLDNDIRIERTDRNIQYNRIRKNLKNIDELKSAVFDQDGYFDANNIKPLSIDTSMLSVGTKGQQFITRNLLIEPNYNGDPGKIKCGDGQLIHFLIDPENIKQWNLTGDTFTLFNQGTFYYIYAKCSKVTNTGVFELSIEQFPTETSSYYYFLIGVLHSVIDNVRGVSLTYGQTTINGKFITTGRIQSIDGFNYFDLDSNEMILGDSEKGIDWNVTQKNKLTIRGGIVQSPSGTLSPISVYKGDWASDEVYFYGDEVSFNGGTYIYINDKDLSGISPTNKDYWRVTAKPGNQPKIIYKRHQGDFIQDGFIDNGFIDNLGTPEGVNPNEWEENPQSGDKPLWMSKSFVDSENNLVASWSKPVKVNGEKGKSLVYRGEFDSTKKYNNNPDVIDVVSYNNVYYTYTGTDGVSLEWSFENWKEFGSQFESVATNTLLSENANIADWRINNGKIVSQNQYEGDPRALLDGLNGKVLLTSPKETYTEDGELRVYKHEIEIDSGEGRILAKHTGDSYQESGETIIDSEGISVTYPGQNPNTVFGNGLKAGIVADVKGKVDLVNFGSALAGIFSKATNTSNNPSPVYGAVIENFLSRGLYINTNTTNNTIVNVEDQDVFISCYNTSPTTVNLPDAEIQYLHRVLIIKALKSDVIINAPTGGNIRLDIDTSVNSFTITKRQIALLINDDIYNWSLNRFSV